MLVPAHGRPPRGVSIRRSMDPRLVPQAQHVLGNLLIITDLKLPSGSSPASATADAAPQFSPSVLTGPHSSVSLRSCASTSSNPNFLYREYPAGDASNHAVFCSLSASSQPHLSNADPAPSRCRVGVAARMPRSVRLVRLTRPNQPRTGGRQAHEGTGPPSPSVASSGATRR